MKRIILTAGLSLAIFVAAIVGLCLIGVIEPALAQAVATVTAPADAPTSTSVIVPYGDWLTWSLAKVRDTVVTGLSGVMLWAVVKIAPQMAAAFTQARVDALVGRAVDFAIAAVEGALHGQSVSVPVANEILRKALEYAVQGAPVLAAKIEGTIRPKIIARMAAAGVVPANASVALIPDPAPQISAAVGLMASNTAPPVVGFVEPYALAA
jgi:hypothetical protein